MQFFLQLGNFFFIYIKYFEKELATRTPSQSYTLNEEGNRIMYFEFEQSSEGHVDGIPSFNLMPSANSSIELYQNEKILERLVDEKVIKSYYCLFQCF